MIFYSSRLGEIECNEDLVIDFPEGIPGFDNYKKYVIIKKGNNNIFFILHSIEDSNLAFIITNPYNFKLDYSFKIPNEDCSLLKIDNGDIKDSLGVFVITKIDNEKNVFINLKAPVCINFEHKIGKQIILYNKDYSHSFKIDKNDFQQEPSKNLVNDIATNLTLIQNET